MVLVHVLSIVQICDLLSIIPSTPTCMILNSPFCENRRTGLQVQMHKTKKSSASMFLTNKQPRNVTIPTSK